VRLFAIGITLSITYAVGVYVFQWLIFSIVGILLRGGASLEMAGILVTLGLLQVTFVVGFALCVLINTKIMGSSKYNFTIVGFSVTVYFFIYLLDILGYIKLPRP